MFVEVLVFLCVRVFWGGLCSDLYSCVYLCVYESEGLLYLVYRYSLVYVFTYLCIRLCIELVITGTSLNLRGGGCTCVLSCTSVCIYLCVASVCLRLSFVRVCRF